MFYDVFRFVRGVWDAVLLPYVILSIANLASDGWEAVTHLQDTVIVLVYFLCGCSHRDFPLSRAALEAQRAALAAASSTTSSSSSTTAAAAGAAPGNVGRKKNKNVRMAQRGSSTDVGRLYGGYQRGSEGEGEDNDADSEADFPSKRRTTAMHTASSPLLDSSSGTTACGSPNDGVRTDEKRDEGADDDDDDDDENTQQLFIQRRLLLGKKGEIDEWLPAVPGHLLIPPNHTLCLSRSLHQLVSIVIGPIQQPTVSTMPTRHPEPQWPPHYMKTGGSVGAGSGGSGGAAGNNNNSGGGGGSGVVAGASAAATNSGNTSVGDPSTDEYSSSASGATPNSMRYRHSASAGAASRYRQASSVVYQRVSSRHLDFSNSRVAPHLIASITAHHVLSYPATRQKVLVMDLDETLCYVSTSTANMAGPPTFSEVIPTASGAELFHVWERPYARLFLATAAKLFNLVLFTSASKPYADTILQRIDPDHLLKLRFYRQDCRLVPRGLLRKMCAVAGMRGVSSGNLGRQGSGSAGGGGGGANGHLSNTSGLRGTPTSTTTPAGPLGAFTSAATPSSPSTASAFAGVGSGDGVRRGGSTGGSTVTNTDDDGRNSRGLSSWEDQDEDRTPCGTRDVPSSGNESTGPSAHASQHRHRSSFGAPTHTLPVCGTHTGTAATGSTAAAVAAASMAADFPVLEKSVLNEHAKVLVKDLRVLKVPPELLVMIDNSEECTLVNPENALIVSPFIPSLTKSTSAEKSVTAGAAAVRNVVPDTPVHDRQGADSAARARTSIDEGGAPVGQQQNIGGGVGETGERSSNSNSSSNLNRADSTSGGASDVAATCRDDGLLMGDDLSANEGPEEDEVLLALLPMLECLLVVPDVRSVLRLGKLY